jgi:hypothetical protein
MHKKYGDRVRFLTLYIKEAHPEDEWQMDINEREGVCYAQPRTLADRQRIAADFVGRFHYPIPFAVDRMDNRANTLYAAWPERLYILDELGRIAYKGKTGPFGYHPEEVERWLANRFARQGARHSTWADRPTSPPLSGTAYGIWFRRDKSQPEPKARAEPIREYQGQAIDPASNRGIQPRAPSQRAIMVAAESETAAIKSAWRARGT